MTHIDTADKIGMYLGGGLIVLGVVVIGLLEMLLGSPHPVTGEGQIVHEALVPLAVRSYIILLGLIVLGLTAIYRLVAKEPMGQAQDTHQQSAD